MRVWLDDVRAMPAGFDVHVKTAPEAIQLIRTNEVQSISLDHDLGDIANAGTGYDVACEIEKRVTEGHKPPRWMVHSANPVGRDNMIAALRAAERLYLRQKNT